MGNGVDGVKDVGDDGAADAEGDGGVEDAGVGGVEDACDGVVQWRTRAAGRVEDEGRCCSSPALWGCQGVGGWVGHKKGGAQTQTTTAGHHAGINMHSP